MNSITFDSKYGNITIYESNESIFQVELNSNNNISNSSNELLLNVKNQILEYFDGLRKSFDVPLLIKGTDYRKKVLNIISNIKYGTTLSYKEVASLSSSPKAIRAVGSICANNKLPILIPCHRVIKSDGSIGKYLGGITMKQSILKLETIQQK